MLWEVERISDASAVASDNAYSSDNSSNTDHYFALVSRYYAYDPISKEMIALKDETNPIEEWQHIEQLKVVLKEAYDTRMEWDNITGGTRLPFILHK